MDLLKTILLYLSMLYVSSVQIAPDPSMVSVTPTPVPTPLGIYMAAETSTPTPTPVPTPAITANPAYGQLVMGDRNETVGNVQRRLQELGYYTDTVDSAYGNITRHAVEEFQYHNGLVVDGIAGKYTQTILFESEDVVPMPVVTNTPAFYPDATITPPPVTLAPVQQATISPALTTPPPEPTEIPDQNAPVLLEGYSFVMDGFKAPVVLQETDLPLHPVEADEALYVPLLEILRSAGNVIITNTQDTTEEVAFTVLADFYQVSYTIGENGTLSNLIFQKNSQPQPLTLRSAAILDNVLYLPMEDMERITGIAFAMDDGSGIITITMPSAGV